MDVPAAAAAKRRRTYFFIGIMIGWIKVVTNMSNDGGNELRLDFWSSQNENFCENFWRIDVRW